CMRSKMASQNELKIEFERRAAADQHRFVENDRLTTYGEAVVLTGLYAHMCHDAVWQLTPVRQLRITWHSRGAQIRLTQGGRVLWKALLPLRLTPSEFVDAVEKAVVAARGVQ